MRLFPCLLGCLLSTGLIAAPDANKFIDIFRPLETETAALSPDGTRIAYIQRDGDTLTVVVREVDRPEKILTRVTVATDAQSKGYMQRDHVPSGAKILWMEWIRADRVALETNYVVLSARGRPTGALYAFDSNGANTRRLITARSGY